MSTSKHIDKICIAAVAITLVITILFMFGGSLGITIAAQAMPYESTIFDTSYVHTIDIVMNDWDSFIETCENEEYASCTVVIDGQKHSNIAIRAKGNTSLSTVSTLNSDRYSFKLEFDHYDSSNTLDGLDKLCLNNLIQDNTMMKDYIVYRMMSDFGVDSPLCSFAYLTVNGEDWGLYLAVEGIEDSFLSRNYGSNVGDLYKPDSTSNGGGRGNGQNFNMDDFDFGNTDSGDTETDNANQETQQSNTQGNSQESTNPNDPTGGQQGMPGGQGGFNPGGQGGQFNPGGDNSGTQQFPGGFNPFGDNSDTQQFPGGDNSDTQQQPGGFNRGDESENQGGFTPGDNSEKGGMQGGGMGSDDVKLKYIDDDPDSYSNIFSSAKTNVTSADEERLIEALKNLSAYTDLENTVDVDEVIRYFVIHNFVCNGDSYTGSMIHNYYLYEEDGILSMIPWDYNLAYGTFQGSNASDTVNTSIDSPVSGGTVDDRPMLGWIFSDETYTEQYHTLFAEFIDKWFTNGELAELITETADMIRPYVEKDPTKFCTTEEFDAGVTALSQFVTLRAEAVEKQLNGDNTKVDTGSLNLSDMGTMNSAGGMNNFGGKGNFGNFDIENINPLSFITLKDASGNTVDITTVIPSTATIVSVTLSDNSTVSFTNTDMQTLMGLDVSKIVSATDSDGNTYDLTPYTISSNMPTMPNGDSGNGFGFPSNIVNPSDSYEGIASFTGGQGASSGAVLSAISVNGDIEISADSSVVNGEQNQNGFSDGNGQGQIPTGPGGNGQGQMPDGSGGNGQGQMPDAPGGNGQGQMPGGPGGNGQEQIPDSTDGTEQEQIPDSTDVTEQEQTPDATDSSEQQQTPDATDSSEQQQIPDATDSSEQRQMPDGSDSSRQRQMPDGADGSQQTNPGAQNEMAGLASEATNWILVGVSVLVLAVGVFIAMKKKY